MAGMKAMWRRIRSQGVRLAMLAGLLVVSGVTIGLAAAYPLQYVKFQESTAVRLDQARLAGQVPVEQALVAAGDLSNSWTPGDPALGGFGILGTDFCGEPVKTPTPLSERVTAVFTNATDQTAVIAQALRVDRWQSARSYISSVKQALGGCSEFYRTGFGARVKVNIKDPSGKAPIADDYVAATFVNADGQSVLEWSMFSVGDVIIAIQHVGPTRPGPTFLGDVERKVLIRIDPKDFAPGGIATETTVPAEPTVSGAGGVPTTTVLQSGAADETGGTATPGAGAAPPTTAAPRTTAPGRTTTTR